MSDGDYAIKVNSISKMYPLYDSHQDRLKEALHPFRKKYHRDFYVLSNVSFEVKRGETLGIIGRNGSGKSTLLSIIAGVLKPTHGVVEVKGRISSLLELGAGFNPELSGMENIYFYGAISGFPKAEMESKVDAILAFADIGDFIYQPVKVYSSGMYIRLAFAVAIQIDPDILIIDEALAVGDMNFQAKCMTALTRIKERGATILFVSHDMGSVRSLCTKAIYLENGTVQLYDDAPAVAERYIQNMRNELNEEMKKFSRVSVDFGDHITADDDKDDEIKQVSHQKFIISEDFDRRVALHRYGTGGAKITYVELLDSEGMPIQSVEFNQKIIIRIYIHFLQEGLVSFGFQIRDEKKINITGGALKPSKGKLMYVNRNHKYIAEFGLNAPFEEGSYSIQVLATMPSEDGNSAEFWDVVDDAVVFKVARRHEARIWSKVYLFPSLHLSKIQNSQ